MIAFLLLLTGCSIQTVKSFDFGTRQEIKFSDWQVSTTFSPKEVVVVGLGDSLTEGIGDELNKGGYFGRVVEEMATWDSVQKVESHNLAKKGRRSDQLLKQLEDKTVINQIKKADVIFITIGGNDMMKIVKRDMFDLKVKAFTKEERAYEKRVKKIVRKIRSQNKQALLVFTGLYNPLSVVTNEETEFNDIVDSWNQTIQTISEEDQHACFAKVYDVFESNSKMVYHTDFFHPNAKGYGEMATQISKAILQCDNSFFIESKLDK